MGNTSKKAQQMNSWAYVTDANGNNIKCRVDPESGEVFLKNPDFFQFVKGGYPAVKKLLREKPLAGNIFMWMVEYMDRNNRLLVSYDALIEEFSKSRMTIYNAMKHLQDEKFLTVVKSGNSNIYCLNANIVWQNSADKREYASFACSVYVTANEQKSKKDIITRVK